MNAIHTRRRNGEVSGSRQRAPPQTLSVRARLSF
jgi:hypothetical protein